jgi:purine-binding chemotaxis protein CheW
MTLHVAFVIGNASYVVPASEVLHLESYETATHVPGAPAFVAGLVQVRGRLVPVVDLRKRFGLGPIEASIDRRVVVVQHGARVAGLLVDSAREVIRIEPSAFEPPPDVLESQLEGFVKGVATVAARLFLLVDIPHVIGEELHHGSSS